MELDVKYMQVNYRVDAQSILYPPGPSEGVTFKRSPDGNNEEHYEQKRNQTPIL